jgi:NifU-like protein involved in Fe-S cluster formation
MSRFSDIMMEHFNYPRNQGRLDSPDRVGVAGTPSHGPFMVIMLQVRNDVVVEAKCETHGCGVTIAAGSMLTELLLNRPVVACRTISAEYLAQALGGVPSDKAHAPALAIAALQNALGK